MAALSYVGCDLTWDDFDQVTGTSAAQELDRITRDRHDIVHRGELPYVKRPLAEQTITLLAAMAKAIDEKVCNLYL